MINISRPIGSATINTYYHEKYTMGDYYSESSSLHGHWFGTEADALGLTGETAVWDFERVMSGRRPDAKFDLDQLGKWEADGTRFVVRDLATNTVQAEVHKTREGWVNDQRPDKRYKSAQAAKTGATRELIGLEIHYRNPERARRAYDIVSRPGKTVSLMAVVGGDKRLIEAHRRANTAMLRAMQQLIQAKGGGDNPSITTGRFVVARFEHYTSRPEEVETQTGEKVLYPAALLHTHNVLANWTRDPDGKIRAIDASEMFRFRSLGKAVYQAHMAMELRQFGYLTEIGKNGSHEIIGHTPEYLASESLRSIAIQEQLKELGLDGAHAASLIAERFRNGKLELNEEQTRALHKANEAAHGNQNAPILAAALERAKTLEYSPAISAEEAVTMAKRSLAEQYSVFEHWELVVKALEYGQGHVLEDAITQNIRERTQTPEQMEQGIRADFMPVEHVREGKPGFRYTTDIQHGIETDLCEIMAQGRNTVEPLARNITPEEIAAHLVGVPLKLETERDVAKAKREITAIIGELKARVEIPAHHVDDPYYETWWNQNGRPLENATFPRDKADDTSRYMNYLTEKYEAWRETEVKRDEGKIERLEKRLQQIQDIDWTVTKNRIGIKLDVQRRFGVLTGGKTANRDQVAAAHSILTSPDRLTAIVGSAGVGKTTVLQVIQQVAQDQGYRIVGVAPTTKAVEKMEHSGVKATTLQGFLVANSPASLAWAKEKVEKLQTRLTKLDQRLEKTKEQKGKAEASLQKSIIVMASVKNRLARAHAQFSRPRRARSVRQFVEREKLREHYATRIKVLTERLTLTTAWRESAGQRVNTLTGRIAELEQETAETREHLAAHHQKVFDRGVSLDGTPRLIFADESSLAGNRQFAELFGQISHGQDRIVLVGDPGQHESIEASRAFDLLLQAGIRRGEIYEIVRQKDPTVKAAVEKCTWGKHDRGLDILNAAGHVLEVRKREERLETTVQISQQHPDESSVIVPDNKTRLEINERIRQQWKTAGRITGEGLTGIILVPKQDMTGVDREVAAKYQIGQVVRFREGSKEHDITRGSYWGVIGINAKDNLLSVYRTGTNGTIEKRSVDPAFFRGTTEVYEKQEREFAAGDRILFKKKEAKLGIVNGTAATITEVDPATRQITATLTKSGKEVKWSLPANELSALPHVEHGYATTSFSVQGDESKYTVAHLDTANKSAKRLISRAMLYVAISRPELEIKIVTNDADKLRNLLRASQDKAMGMSPEERYEFHPETYEAKQEQKQQKQGMAIGA